MKLRTLVINLLIVAFLAPCAHAQDSPEMWRSFAEQLAPGSFVVVHLRDGKSVQGRLVQVAADGVSVLPKTRLAVPVRNLRFAEIQSIDPRREGMNPGAKALTAIDHPHGSLTLLARMS